jgi:hypothetical protein
MRTLRWMTLIALLPLIFEPSAKASWTPKLTNNLSFYPTYYPEDLGQGTTQWSTPIRDELDVSVKPYRDFKMRLAPMVYSDPSATSVSEQFIFDVLEANAEYRANVFSAKVGINNVAWGVTDIFNPLDVVSPRRYTDILNIEKRGVPSVILTLDTGEWLLEGLFVPVQQISILPGERSRWLPRDLAFTGGNTQGEITLSPQLQYLYFGPGVSDNALDDNFGFRAEHHGRGLDLSAIFFQGAPTAPAIFLAHVLAPAIDITPGHFFATATQVSLQPVYYLRQTVGAGAVVTLDSAIIRLAASYSDRMDSDYNLPGWATAVVVGVEKNFSVWKESTLTALLQATECNHQDPPGNFITSIDRVFDQSYLLGLRLASGPNWTYSAAGLYDVRYQDGYIQLKTEHKITDGLSASVSADWLDGSEGTPIGTYRGNKRMTVGMTTEF